MASGFTAVLRDLAVTPVRHTCVPLLPNELLEAEQCRTKPGYTALLLKNSLRRLSHPDFRQRCLG